MTGSSGPPELVHLKEAAPAFSRAAALWNLAKPTVLEQVKDLGTAAQRLNVRLDVLDAGDRPKLNTALATIEASGTRGHGAFFVENRVQLVQFPARKRLVAG